MITGVKKILKLLCLFVIILCLNACKGDKFREIPVPPVSFVIRPYSMDNELMAVGNHKIFPTKGYNGIIVLHMSKDEFVAYDLACPNDYEHACTVAMYKDFYLKDEECCGSTFSTLTGFPIESDYHNILHSYNVIWINSTELQVRN